MENNLNWNIKNPTRLQENVLLENFNKRDTSLTEAVISLCEFKDKKNLTRYGKKILETNSIENLISGLTFKLLENYDSSDVKNTIKQINKISTNDVNYAAGIAATSIKQIDAKIAPSVMSKGIPSFTFESFTDLFSKNKRKVNGDDIINYVYNPFFNDYGIVMCSKVDDSLIFGYFTEKGKPSKIINNNMNSEFISSVQVIIFDEIIKNKSKKVEFNVKAYSDIFPVLKNILEKNGYYYVNNSSIPGYYVFEDGIEQIKEMEEWDFSLKDGNELAKEGELSPMTITKTKKPNTGMNEGLNQQDQTDVTAAIGILSGEMAKNQNAKNDSVDSSLTKLTPNQQNALKRTAPQSMVNSKSLGDLVQNVGKELTSKGDTITLDKQGTNKNKEMITTYGTEQNITPNTNGINS